MDYDFEMEDEWFDGAKTVGVTSGASVLDKFMDPVVLSIVKNSLDPEIEYQDQVKKEPMGASYPLPESEIEKLRQRFS